MNKIVEKIQEHRQERKMRKWAKVWIPIVVVLVSVAIVLTGLIAYANSYKHRVLPGVHVGNIPIGGMDQSELKTFLQDITDKLANEGIEISFTGGEKINPLILQPVVLSDGTARDYVHVDIPAAVDALMTYRKQHGLWSSSWGTILTRFQKPNLPLSYIEVSEDFMIQDIVEHIGEKEVEPRNAGIQVTSFKPFTYEIVSSTVGKVYTYDNLADDVAAAWKELRAPIITLAQQTIEPGIQAQDVEEIADRFEAVVSDGVTFSFEDKETTRTFDWYITPAELAVWISVKPTTGTLVYSIDEELVEEYLDNDIAPTVNIEPRSAKFEINESGRVVEFRGARPGRELNKEEIIEKFNDIIRARTINAEGVEDTIDIVPIEAKPENDTGAVNEFGIAEPLGVGVSSFKGSPTNRVKNIQNGARKLDGILLAPGEEFSSIGSLAPFTLEAGYLPEKVIKGDEIKPEIGGGLCQIGTTLFRMAMNSGMEITQRRNHSLVVSYYNDPTNNLPGTDATIYEPAPDFKFKNDTEHHVLIQTYVDLKRSELVFTLWGTNDGRTASYTAPEVSRWIPAGGEKIIETTKIPVGKRECQSAFTGADAAFTYTRTIDGKTENIVYESHYRPLPKICLVGVAEEEVVEELSEEEKAQRAEERRRRLQERLQDS